MGKLWWMNEEIKGVGVDMVYKVGLILFQINEGDNSDNYVSDKVELEVQNCKLIC